MSIKKIIRSLAWSDPNLKTQTKDNYKVVKTDRLKNLTKQEKEILDHLVEFYTQYGDAPSMKVVQDHFETNNKPAEVALLSEAEAEQFYQGASFDATFEREVEEQTTQVMKQTFSTAMKIAVEGVTFKGTLTKGPNEAVSYVFSTLEPVPSRGDNKVPANMTKANQALSDLYYARKKNPHNTYGVPAGYQILDLSTAGFRKKTFSILMGFNGHLKSSLIFNMAVNQAVYGYNPSIFTSEMPSDDVKFLLIAIHSADKKFNGIGKPLIAKSLLLGALNSTEEKFFEEVKDDLLNNPDHGVIRVVDNSEFSSWGSIKQRIVRDDIELPVDMVWVDYVTRLPIDYAYRQMNLDEARNETLIDCKRFAMQFKNGVGIPIGTAFQTNRIGYKAAKDNKGKYTLTALAQYNAAEKEADFVGYIWFDEAERLLYQPKLGLLKSRYGGVPNNPVELFIEPDSRRIMDMGTGIQFTIHAPPTMTAGKVEDEVLI